MEVFWLTAFLDFAADEHDDGVELWQRLTGYRLSPPRGDDGEFATLVPPDGDDYLRVQRLRDGGSRTHLDIHVADPRAAAAEAERAGATTVADRGYVVMRSPGSFTFCLVSHPAGARPRPTQWPYGGASFVDQLCVDIPQEHWEAEIAFWSRIIGGEPYVAGPEFARLPHRPELPLRFLFQRLGEPTGDVRAHLDWATSDRAAETARHEEAGTTVVERFDHWTVLRGPRGTTYCLTDRDPETGVPPG